MDPIIDELEAEIEATIDSFDSDDGLHHVVWDYWHDEKNDISYDTWVCNTHHRLYYGDCAQKG